MKKSALQKYAQLIVRSGINVQKGQEVVIKADLDQPEFIEMLARECYLAGAAKVTVDWSYLPITKLHVDYRSEEVLGKVEKWEEEKLRHNVQTVPCVIRIESEDPDGLKGIDQKKYMSAQQKRQNISKPYTDELEGKYQWCIAGVPGKKWAKKVFPELSPAKAMERLWEAILSVSRVDDDPIAAWRRHNEDLQSHCDHLNTLGITELIYRSSNGTDLTVGLIPQAQFCGGGETSLGGVYFNPNIPTEECFTSPMRGKAEGIVYSTMPLSYQGQLIEDFSVRFEGGRAVEVRAAKNQSLLEQMISADEGASYLGECALVPYDSPIRNSGILFYNTLYDENASCHLALGRGYIDTIKDYEKYTLEQMRAMGINDSMIHVDFMIGSEDLSIKGRRGDGSLVDIFTGGGWAF
ncbi:MAG: aminopeptidase [Oscillospiraceae bacterium]|nr:aminopeptidase [Oscillospiraceae bacterium]